MPRLDAVFGADGPIVDIRLWIAPAYHERLTADGAAAPSPFSVTGLVDTGAKRTAIQRSLATWMGIPIISLLRLKSSVLGAEEREAPAYEVRMTFGPLEAPDPPKWRAIVVAGVDVVSPGASVLIGRDLLATCRFTYDGRKQRLMISY
jgi:hypothetical protein